MLEGNPSDPRDFHHPSNAEKRMEECEKLNQYLKSIGQGNDFWDRVKLIQQDPWQRLRENDVNNQMRQFQLRQ